MLLHLANFTSCSYLVELFVTGTRIHTHTLAHPHTHTRHVAVNLEVGSPVCGQAYVISFFLHTHFLSFVLSFSLSRSFSLCLSVSLLSLSLSLSHTHTLSLSVPPTSRMFRCHLMRLRCAFLRFPVPAHTTFFSALFFCSWFCFICLLTYLRSHPLIIAGNHQSRAASVLGLRHARAARLRYDNLPVSCSVDVSFSKLRPKHAHAHARAHLHRQSDREANTHALSQVTPSRACACPTCS